MRRRYGSWIFRHLDYVNSMLIYLQKSVKREGVICFAQNGKYKLNEVELDIGDVIEILIFSEDTKTYRWKPIMIKGDVDLEGKAARMRV